MAKILHKISKTPVPGHIKILTVFIGEEVGKAGDRTDN